MRSTIIDQWLLGTALAAALFSSVWFGRSAPPGRHHRSRVVDRKSAAAYRPAAVDQPVEAAEEWLPPPAQTRGPRWVYEVFTPPEIRYDENSRQFAVTPPNEGTGSNATTTLPGVVLLAVKREPFRLQLVGYVGGQGNFLGAFENLHTTEVFLGGAGRQVPALDLMIADFSVERRPTPVAQGMTSNHWVATAVVHNLRTGEDTTLTAGERIYTDNLRAVLAEDVDESESTLELRPGDEFENADRTYRVERLQMDPPVAELTEASAGVSTPTRWSLSASANGSTPTQRPNEPLAGHDN
jgi:hypothetical protein